MTVMRLVLREGVRLCSSISVYTSPSGVLYKSNNVATITLYVRACNCVLCILFHGEGIVPFHVTLIQNFYSNECVV